MDGNRDKDITPERVAYLVNKWKDVLDYTKMPLSAYNTKAILIEAQEQWFSGYDGKRFSSFEEREAYDKAFLDL